MTKPIDLPGIRNITISGRIASGATTLAHHLAHRLGWEMLDGGKLFRAFTKDHGYAGNRPDEFDLAFEEKVKQTLQDNTKQIIQSHLSGFDAQGIQGVFKIIAVCEDGDGVDKTDIRIDRLVNRDNMTVEEAKREIIERDKQNLEKYRRLYANNNQTWVYWDKKYYDLVVNTFSHNAEESLQFVLDSIGYR